MNKWVVDTCVIIDVLSGATSFRRNPIADVLIGAYAMQKGGLITRNEADFKALYPNLTIFNPISLTP